MPPLEINQLRPYLPAAAFPTIHRYLSSMKVMVKVVAPRSTKLGDYRSSADGRKHVVTVNNDLNIYCFTVTLIHELAHFVTYARTRKQIKPHGVEWQHDYRLLLSPLLNRRVFPADLIEALTDHLEKAPASSCADHELMRALHRYDRKPGRKFVEDVREGTHFQLNGRTFVKGPQLRKRFRCKCLSDRRIYFVDPLAEIRPLRVKQTAA